jgi:hypothetical protein
MIELVSIVLGFLLTLGAPEDLPGEPQNVRLGASMPSSVGALVYSNNLVYQGSFKVPNVGGGVDANSYAYAQGSTFYNPANNSIYLTGFNQLSKIGEISIPALGTGSVASLNRSTALQALTELTEGTLPNINPGDPNVKLIGGTFTNGSNIFINAYSYYDGAGSQQLSIFKSGLTFATTGDVTGPFRMGTTVDNGQKNSAGFVSGYMGIVPAAWRTSFGGDTFVGNCCLGILGRTSSGPSLGTINIADIGVTEPAPLTMLVYYPIDHQAIGQQYSGADPCSQAPSLCAPNFYFNGSSAVRGVVMPNGKDAVLFFGRHPQNGNYCYGSGTSDPALHGTLVGPSEPGVIYCYDVDDHSKGSHGYPYAYHVWAYRASDMAAVKSGSVNPWAISPYAVWNMTFPYSHTLDANILGVAYNTTTGVLYIVQANADGTTGSQYPLIHAYLIT